MQREVMDALWGGDVSADDFLKLGDGAIQTVLCEENETYERMRYVASDGAVKDLRCVQ